MTSTSNPTASPPTVGDPAPDLVLPDQTGAEVRLSSFWSSAPSGAVFVFLRHFGCLFCREHARELRAHASAFADRGATLVLIGQGTPKRAARFRDDNDLPFPILADRVFAGYAAYGLGKATAAGLANPALYAAGLRALAHGARQGLPAGGDRRQLPGAFYVDYVGIVRFAKPAAHAGDLASVAELLAAIDGNSS